MSSSPFDLRIDRILGRCIAQFGLDLGGLVVFTEAASGPYLYTPVLAALAGASKVYARTKDSSHASKETVLAQTMEAARIWGVADRLEVVFERERKHIAQSDIVTNSGFVRPIDKQIISWMKPTAVIPLMWETWEFRDSDLDLSACKESNILVLGTDEAPAPHSMYPYAGYLAMKLLFELGLEGYKTKTLLLGGHVSLGKGIHEHFKQLEMEVTWFSDSEKESLPYQQLAEHFFEHGASYDALILAEHQDERCLLGPGGLLTYDQIARINPALCIGVIAGNLDARGLKRSGLSYLPETIRPFGFESYQFHSLGPLPVLDLYAAGLKVGQTMACARLSGLVPKEAAAYALKHSPAMDFLGRRAWL